VLVNSIIGLLALGEWGPPAGAISGSVTSVQAEQKSLAAGNVEELILVGGGGGSWIWPRLEITGTVRSAQARQQSVAIGEMIDTELEMLTALLMAAD
jgi:hypothetical protein